MNSLLIEAENKAKADLPRKTSNYQHVTLYESGNGSWRVGNLGADVQLCIWVRMYSTLKGECTVLYKNHLHHKIESAKTMQGRKTTGRKRLQSLFASVRFITNKIINIEQYASYIINNIASCTFLYFLIKYLPLCFRSHAQLTSVFP